MEDEMDYWETPEGIAESTKQLKAFFAERMNQDDLPAHKRTGYAEQMALIADTLRKEIKENGG